MWFLQIFLILALLNEIEKMLENAGLLIYEHLPPAAIHQQFLVIAPIIYQHSKHFILFMLLKNML